MEITSLIIALVGLGFGLPSVIMFFRNKNTKLIYVEKSQINIQEDFLKNFNDLSIKYKGSEIRLNLIFVRGYIICDGNKDICTESNQIQIKAQEKTKWVDFKIISKSEGLEVSYNSNDNIANVNFDLLKSKEYIGFEGFIELAESIKTNKINLTFFHRIANIKAIQKLKIDKLKNGIKIPLIAIIYSFLCLIGLSFLNEIETYNVNIYDAKTDVLIVDDFNFKYSDEFQNLLKQLKKKKRNYYFLMIKKSETYPIKYKNYNNVLSNLIHSNADTIMIDTCYIRKDVYNVKNLFEQLQIEENKNYVIKYDDHLKDLQNWKGEKDIYIRVDIGIIDIMMLIFELALVGIFIWGVYSIIYYFTKRNYLQYLNS
ncbi:MAG: hypothetical protein FWC39_02965 [Bacteroidetes bacterium]|nr:hypothetical protein [Bacteroidota bacterium]